MMRCIALLLVGFLAGALYGQFFPQAVPAAPAVLRSTVTSIEQKVAPSLVAAAPVQTGPLGESIQAEKRKDYDEALKQIVAYQQAGGDTFIAAERAGWLYYLKGAYAEAEQAYGSASRIHGAALNPVLGLLNVAEAMKDPARIQAAAQAVLRIDPSNYRAAMALGGRQFATRDYRAAAFTYRRVLVAYPDDADARSGVAWADYYTGDSVEALAQFRMILGIYPDYPFAKQGVQLTSRVNGGSTSMSATAGGRR